MSTRILFLKAAIPGGALGDLLASPVSVSGHMRAGRYVAPYTGRRKHHGAVQPSEGIKHFYVSAIDGPRSHLGAGPYPTHEAALARVEEVRRHAAEVQPGREAFMAWGTAGTAEPVKTPLGPNWTKVAA